MTAAGYVGSLRQIAENVRELCPDEDVAADLYLLIYNRKGLTRLVKSRRARWYRRRKLGEWVSELASFAEEFVPRSSTVACRPHGAGCRLRYARGTPTRSQGSPSRRLRTRRPRKRQPGKAASSRRVVEGAVRRYGRGIRRRLIDG